MALHPFEEATIRAFAVPPRQDRLLFLLSHPKRRHEVLDSLNHFKYWDARFARPLDSCADALCQLVEAGAPSECHIMSDQSDLDRRDMPLEEAIAACEDGHFASVLCCVPGFLAFFIDESAAPRSRVLLQRPRTGHGARNKSNA